MAVTGWVGRRMPWGSRGTETGDKSPLSCVARALEIAAFELKGVFPEVSFLGGGCGWRRGTLLANPGWRPSVLRCLGAVDLAVEQKPRDQIGVL